MSDFAASWQLSRQRLIDEVSDLNQEQLNWKIHPNSLSIAEGLMHVAGVEVSFATQLMDTRLDEYTTRLKTAATDGVVNERVFPYSAEEMTLEFILQALEVSKSLVEPVITSPTETILKKEMVSALGPVITGYGALTRLGFHSAYHQGQSHMIRTAPGFPVA